MSDMTTIERKAAPAPRMYPRAFGAAPVDLPFLIASPTTPTTVTAALWLRD